MIPPSAIPETKADALAWIQLARASRVGPVTFLRLLRQFGSAPEALKALPDIAAAAGARKYVVCGRDQARDEYDRTKALGATLFCLGAPGYPRALHDIPDPPPVLWALGDASLLERPRIALVGARNASAIGRRMSAHLAAELGKLGYVIVSGLARGIDAEAHGAAMETGTIGVTAAGLDNIYPKENAPLFEQIQSKGLHLTEMPIGLSPQARHFPRRNRIISGLAQAVVVIEGAAKSGSLITAQIALDQGRDVMAVPGHPLDRRAAGCNHLIKDGALLVSSADDIHQALQNQRQKPEPVEKEPELPLAPPQALAGLDTALMGLLSPSPVAEDDLIRQISAPPPDVLEALQELDIKGKISRHPGRMVALAV